MDRHALYFTYFSQLGYTQDSILSPPELLDLLEKLVPYKLSN